MLKSYEAIYDHGHLRWIHQSPPEIRQEMRVIVVLDVPHETLQTPQETIRSLLRRTRGTLGRGKSIHEVDQEIQTMRKEWDREWEK